MDMLVLENCLLEKVDQKPWVEQTDWREEFGLFGISRGS
jgi:hypothetical protein